MLKDNRVTKTILLGFIALLTSISFGETVRAASTNIHWSSPVIYVQSLTKSKEYNQLLNTAIQQYNATEIITLVRVKSGGQITFKLKRNLPSSPSPSDNTKMIGNIILGNTHWTSDGNYLTNCQVQIDNQILQQCGYTKRAKLHVIEHELGHALGLSHNGKDKNSIMYPTTSWNCKAKVDKNDINLLRQLYLKPCN